MKKVLSALLIVIMLLSIVPFSASAANKITLVKEKVGTIDTGKTKVCKFTVEYEGLVVIKFSSSDTYGDAMLKIKDESGNVVYSKQISSSFTEVKVSKTLEKGNYVLSLTENDDFTFDYGFTVYLSVEGDIPASSVKLNKTNATLTVGNSVTLSATVEPTITTLKPEWKSSDTNVATVNSKGVVTAKSLGKAKITVTVGKKSATCLVTVNKAPTKNILVGKTLSLKSTFSTIKNYSKAKWTSSDKKIATVDSKGVVTAKAKGKVVISATVDGVKYSININAKTPSILLDKTSATLYVCKNYRAYKNGSIQLTATTFPADKTVTWKSSNTSVAKVSDTGKVTAVSKGTATITASFKYGGKTYSKKCSITVKKKDSVTINYVDWVMNSADGIEPEITLTNNTNQDIKYIRLTTQYLNAVGDIVYNDINYDDYEILRITGPIKAGSKTPHYWDAVFYNSQVHAILIKDIEIEYMNGKKETFNYDRLWYDSRYYG